MSPLTKRGVVEVAEWRYLRGWTKAELAARLDRTRPLLPNFSLEAEKTSRFGWNHVHSSALIALDEIGAPMEGGVFGRLWQAVQRFEHSDPRIVVAHFRETTPFNQRRLLLELRAMGLRYLCPAEIGAACGEDSQEATVRRFAVDTLEGHIERGREWFILEKDHLNGEIRFQIEAVWRPADFPNLWSRIGFHLVGKRYQRAWHRLAHLRLRRLAASLEPHGVAAPKGGSPEPTRLPAAPVQFYAQQNLGYRRLRIEEEE